jgi:adenine-specific DNA-methyltransferase
MMYPRLVLLRELLAEDGSIWVSIDDREAHYLKVLMDEVFGRANFIASNIWQKGYSRENREAIGDVHEYIMVFVKNPDKFKAQRNRIPLDESQAKIYRNPENPNETDSSKRWRGLPMTAQGYRLNQMYKIISPKGKEHLPPEGRCWSMIEPEFLKLKEKGRIYWGKDGNAQPSLIRYLSEVEGLVPWTWWPHEEVGHTDESKKEIHELFGKVDAFGSPKPERLLQRMLQIATNPTDLVLDSFLGSGTTAAVAHKMGRRYIGIEMGEHAVSHCIPRLQKVIEGEQGGISKAVNWQGGGGFRFYTLGDPVFLPDGSINPAVRFASLAAYLWHFDTGEPWQIPTLTRYATDARNPLYPGEVKVREKLPVNTSSSPQSLDYSTLSPSTLPKGDGLYPFLGIHQGTAYYLLYNGILGDRTPQGGNVLTSSILAHLLEQYPHDGAKVIYGETTRLGDARLRAEGIEFRQIPYDIPTR